MWIVGMTGGIGCGKSEAAKQFAGLGVPVVDVDKISHALTATGQATLKEITKAFGADILTSQGALDRAALREKIFSDAQAKKTLEAIMHPAIFERVLAELDEHKNAAYQIIDIPLLFESERYLKLINRSLVIDCDPALQISRVKARSALDADAIQKIINAQTPREERNQLADDIIVNDGSIEDLQLAISKLHEKYVKACIIKESNT